MTKAREIAELGQKLTVDASGNIDIAGNITSDGLTVDGNVGIGTSSANSTLHISTSEVSSVPAAGTGAVEGLMVSADLNTYGTMLGTTTDGKGYIQQQRTDTATHYDLLIQPNGGSVGIGTSSPSVSKLHLNYNSVDSRGIRLQDQNGTYDLITSGGGDNNSFGIFNDTVGAYRLFIDSSGRVGIGTSSPNYKFEVSDGTRTAVINPNATLDGIFVGTKESKPLILGTGDNERMRIDSSGRVGIGISSPTQKLVVDGNIFASTGDGGGFIMEGGNAILRQGVNGMGFNTNGSERMRITDTGRVGINRSNPNCTLGVLGPNLSSTAGSFSTVFDAASSDGNISSLRISNYRYATGSDHTTGETRLQRRVDSTDFGFIGFRSTQHAIRLSTGYNRPMATFGESSIVFNEDSNDIDFRVESDSNANMFIVDAGDNRVKIGDNATSAGMLSIQKTVNEDTNISNTPSLVIRNRSLASGTNNIGGGIFFDTYRDIQDTCITAGIWFNKQPTGNVANHADIIFGTNTQYGESTNKPTERMRITAEGNVLVGTPSLPSSSVSGTRIGTGFVYTSQTGTSSSTHLAFINANGQVGGVVVTGSSTSYNTSSDYRLKTDAQPMTGASARVQALNPVNFEWIASGERVDGFLAHEAQAVVPEAVTGTKDAMRDEEYEVTPAVEATYDEDGNVLTEAVPAVMGTRSVPDYQGIDQSKLVPLLTAALQEALTKIDELEARLTAIGA